MASDTAEAANSEADGPVDLSALTDVIGYQLRRAQLAVYPFYPAALGEFEYRRRHLDSARGHFCAALALARNPMERRYLSRRVGACEDGRHDPRGGGTDVIVGIPPATADADLGGDLVAFEGGRAAAGGRHPYEQMWLEIFDKLKEALQQH